MQKVLLDWGLDKVMTVTIDNASANDSGVSYLRRQMNNLKTSIAQDKYLHMRCVAHIVNLIVQDGLREVDMSIKRVRAAVRFIKNSPSRLIKFKECAALEKVESKLARVRMDSPISSKNQLFISTFFYSYYFSLS